jgi:hypothetical protein
MMVSNWVHLMADKKVGRAVVSMVVLTVFLLVDLMANQMEL